MNAIIGSAIRFGAGMVTAWLLKRGIIDASQQDGLTTALFTIGGAIVAAVTMWFANRSHKADGTK